MENLGVRWNVIENKGTCRFNAVILLKTNELLNKRTSLSYDLGSKGNSLKRGVRLACLASFRSKVVILSSGRRSSLAADWRVQRFCRVPIIAFSTSA
jgi:hypothetical protein